MQKAPCVVDRSEARAGLRLAARQREAGYFAGKMSAPSQMSIHSVVAASNQRTEHLNAD